MKKSILFALIIAGFVILVSFLAFNLQSRYTKIIQSYDGSLCLDTTANDNCKIKNEYLAAHLQEEQSGGKSFCAHIVMGGNETKEYIWVVCGEFSMENGILKEKSGRSGPVAITIQTSPDGYSVVSHQLPGDGNLYSRDLKIMLPKHITERQLFFVPSIFDRARSREAVSILISELERKARIYFDGEQ